MKTPYLYFLDNFGCARIACARWAGGRGHKLPTPTAPVAGERDVRIVSPSEAKQRATMGVPKVRALARGLLAAVVAFGNDTETLGTEMFFDRPKRNSLHAVC